MILNKTGITVSQVATCLGTSSRDVGQLCTSNNINMWAKYKPVTLLNNPTPSRSGDWWKGDDGSCNITIKRVASTTEIVNMYNNNDCGWTYVTAQPPYRLADFGGYNHEATPPLRCYAQDVIKVMDGVSTNASITIMYTTPAANTLNLNEISTQFTSQNSLGQWYAGFLFTTTDRKYPTIVTSAKKIGENTEHNENIPVSITRADAGDMYIYPIICTSAYISPTNTLHRGDYLIPLPNSTKLTTKIQYVTTLFAQFTSDSYFVKEREYYTFHGHIKVVNNGLTQRKQGNMMYRPRYKYDVATGWKTDPRSPFTLELKGGEYVINEGLVGSRIEYFCPPNDEIVGFDFQFYDGNFGIAGTSYNIITSYATTNVLNNNNNNNSNANN